MQILNNGMGNVQMKHTFVLEIPTALNGGLPTEVYVSMRSNGNNTNLIAFSDNRTSITCTRIGDASI